MPPPRRVFTGNVYGSWTVVQYRPNKSLCQCSCGTVCLVCNTNLTGNGSKRCKGCQFKGQVGKPTRGRKSLRWIPRETYLRLLTMVVNVIKRCTDPLNVAYKNYGERGITIYPAWQTDKWQFIGYLAQLPGYDDPELVLDRIDNDGNYEPGNLRFTTRQVSSLNRRRDYGARLRKGPDGRFTGGKGT